MKDDNFLSFRRKQHYLCQNDPSWILYNKCSINSAARDLKANFIINGRNKLVLYDI